MSLDVNEIIKIAKITRTGHINAGIYTDQKFYSDDNFTIRIKT